MPAQRDGRDLRLATTMSRRDAEMLVLALRQRLKALGYDGARITVAPSPDTGRGAGGADRAGPSV